MSERYKRHRPDLAAYVERTLNGPCFICCLVAGEPDFRHHVVYEDKSHIAFLSKGQTQYGYTLVAPKSHREQVAGDFTVEEYLELQRVVYRIAEAIRKEVAADRIYLMSLGSNEGNAHVHWHVAPLPPGVPYEEQQYAAVRVEAAGVLDVPENELASLAKRIRGRIQ